MSKFQSLLMALTFASISSFTVYAEWSKNPEQNLLVSGQNAIGQDLVLTAAGPENGTYISWLSWENQNAYLKLQLIDKDGNSVWEDGGIYVSQNPTPTWSSGFDISSDADGNALIVFPDSRNGSWHSYAYKITPNGEMAWGNGIPLLSDAKESSLNPKLITTDAGNVIIGFQSLIGSKNSLKFTKLNANGEKMWGGMITISGTNGLFNMVESLDDTFFIDYILGDTGEVAVMRYTANGEEAWDEAVKIDNGTAVVSTEPVACSDFQGGIIVGWRFAPSSFEIAGALQTIDRQGTLLWSDFKEFPNMPQVSSDSFGNIYASYTLGALSNDNLFITKYDPQGNLLWETDPIINSSTGQISIYGMAAIDSNIAVVYRNSLAYNLATIDCGYVNSTGEVANSDIAVSSMTGDKGRGSLTLSKAGDLVLAWADNGMSKGGGKIYAQRVDLPSISGISSIQTNDKFNVVYRNGIIHTEFTNGMTSIYDYSGKITKKGMMVNGMMETGSLMPGVYLITNGDKCAKLFVAN